MKALEVIRDEHRALAAVLRAVKVVVGDIAAGRRQPDFRLLSACVDYIVRLPEDCHHPKEDDVLFPHVRQACAEAGPILDELERQHARGRDHIQALALALIHYQAVGAAGAADFCRIADTYVEFHWTHIEIEERQLLPLLTQALSPEAWAEIDAAFAANADPWRGADDEFAALFSRIAQWAPAPLGLG